MITTNRKRQAWLFLLLIGFIALLSDFTHEGGRSIYGPYLNTLGVSIVLISFIAGLGEFIGQALRIVTGIIADHTKRYWTMMIVGYAVNLLAIPLLMFVTPNIWQVALILILLERVGKGIRAPAKSALVSFTTQEIGYGKAFALQEAMDQIGAFLGPLFVFTILSIQKGSDFEGYQLAFGLLGIFAILTLVVIVLAKLKYPNPDQMETSTIKTPFKTSKAFVIYLVAVMLLAIGFIDYPILAYHLDHNQLIEAIHIPLLYAFAMGIDAIAAVIFGIYFDKKGFKALVVSVGFAMWIAPIFYLVPGVYGIVLGIIFWGIAMGAQESILKAVIASLVSKDKRASAYGYFYAAFGFAWFVGSSLMGLLYTVNIAWLVMFSFGFELLAFIAFIYYQKVGLKYVQQH